MQIISDFISYLVNEVQTNDFMSAALVAAPASMLMYALRNIPGAIYGRIKHFLTLEIQFNSDMMEYHDIQTLIFNECTNNRFTRTFLFSKHGPKYSEIADDESPAKSGFGFGLTSGYGMAFGRFRNTFLVVNRQAQEANATDQFKETLSITFLNPRKQIIWDFCTFLKESLAREKEEPSVPIWVSGSDYWMKRGKLPVRNLDTIFVEGDVGHKICRDIRKFETDKPFYRAKGLPYHLGIILSGPPGTGKSSLIHAIASDLDRKICYLNLNEVENDSDLSSLLSALVVRDKSIVVIEDIDAASSATHDRNSVDATTSSEFNKLSLSAILNSMDGLLSSDGMIIIATTNHISRLDKALVRPGRFDHHYDIGELSFEKFSEMADLFEIQLPENMKDIYVPVVGAVARKFFLENDMNGMVHYFSGLNDLLALETEISD